ncbi:hypothetical protein ACA910_011917 [Epithemia clementina (nom. ined.)]
MTVDEAEDGEEPDNEVPDKEPDTKSGSKNNCKVDTNGVEANEYDKELSTVDNQVEEDDDKEEETSLESTWSGGALGHAQEVNEAFPKDEEEIVFNGGDKES